MSQSGGDLRGLAKGRTSSGKVTLKGLTIAGCSSTGLPSASRCKGLLLPLPSSPWLRPPLSNSFHKAPRGKVKEVETIGPSGDKSCLPERSPLKDCLSKQGVTLSPLRGRKACDGMEFGQYGLSHHSG